MDTVQHKTGTYDESIVIRIV